MTAKNNALRLMWLSVCSAVLSFLFFIWSFTQTDPNLYFFTNTAFVQFQHVMWNQDRQLVTGVCIAFVLGLFLVYGLIVKELICRPRLSKRIVALYGISLLFLLLSNNALSHDLFNYIFNAKMLAVYHVSPNIHTALEFANRDDWVRFMHNVHTTSPYGVLWSYFTVLPFVVGVGKFILTFLSFKLFMAIGFVLVVVLLEKLIHILGLQKPLFRISLFALNPLMLIETLSSGHNDIWMMAIFLGSLFLLMRARKIVSLSSVGSLILLILSTQVKFVTLLLIPIWGILFFHHFGFEKKLSGLLCSLYTIFLSYWAECAASLLFIPLFTARSQRFNPWYLVWSLSFLPFFKSKPLGVLLILFSFTSMLRYIPFLWWGTYTPLEQSQSFAITWSAFGIWGVWFLFTTLYKRRVVKQ
ncbi:hypothetical protein C5B42_00835 [Candidatus Cerribacteria bacterium 'Amazon FNV 2010 28 9']|uniref:DUF2029 domain-containing protein n=1 Tax=Candidatus Cerribacteria bacterium 'Amazon FNV 2010 28 9' TaxID=2081795 RepID=A0A317JU11_9BACT|nr:MAG: hypothetical protein C5B42_00835 [Candidatus Cerribacteria bacterium 'Amazon FNV 2010 28 9']